MGIGFSGGQCNIGPYPRFRGLRSDTLDVEFRCFASCNVLDQIGLQSTLVYVGGFSGGG